MRERLRALPLPRPELAVLLALAALLYLWGLSQNGWANDYYSAAVRSMAGSWHDFLYGSFDAKGLMTVDKPPLALWVEALSAKVFGFNSLAILVPQALMGVASVGLLYDLTRRRFGRAAGALAGLALALTPVVVAISRHNNPDALLVLCSVGALWCFVRALEDGATGWLVAAGVCVGLGFEAKMGAALMVVPGMVLAWLWVAPRGRLVAVRQLAWAGAALVAVALAWPVLVWLTPAGSRPWISGTSDNSIWSLVWEYNGFGRLEGQTGGPGAFGGAGGGPFGGATGLFRLLNESLGGQAGWLLGAASVGGLGIAVLSRLRRADPRTGWIIAVGGAFAVTATAFSYAGGIFHPYYTSLLAPFAAALVGATFGQVLAGERGGERQGADLGRASAGERGGAAAIRLLGALAIGAGAVVELVVIDQSATDLGRLVVPLVLVAIAAACALLFADPLADLLAGARGASPSRAVAPGERGRWSPGPGVGPARIRLAALACGLGILLVGPAIWSIDTLGHPTSGTFPAGGPESVSMMDGPGGAGFGSPGGPAGGLGGREEAGQAGIPGGEGFGGSQAGGGVPIPPAGEGFPGSERAELPGIGGASELGIRPLGHIGPQSTNALGGAGGMFGGESLTSVLEYTEAHGGGTVAVDSQSEAAASIIESGAEVAGIGGFSGKESSVSAAWLEERIESGAITWIYTSGLGAAIGGPPTGGIGGDTRTGSESAIETAVRSCTEISSSAYESSSESTGTAAVGASGTGTLYKCDGS